jgi:hypothetical protein
MLCTSATSTYKQANKPNSDISHAAHVLCWWSALPNLSERLVGVLGWTRHLNAQAISYVDAAGAAANFKSENTSVSELRLRAQRAWVDAFELVPPPKEGPLDVYHTAVYHTMVSPYATIFLRHSLRF